MCGLLGQAMIQEIQNGVIHEIAAIHDYRLHSAALQLPDHEAVAFLCKNEKTGSFSLNGIRRR